MATDQGYALRNKNTSIHVIYFRHSLQLPSKTTRKQHHGKLGRFLATADGFLQKEVRK
jgi:hypothetical protein